MKKPILIARCVLLLPWLPLPAVAGEENPLVKYLTVSGATVTLPLDVAIDSKLSQTVKFTTKGLKSGRYRL
jgi:hypothetical protein